MNWPSSSAHVRLRTHTLADFRRRPAVSLKTPLTPDITCSPPCPLGRETDLLDLKTNRLKNSFFPQAVKSTTPSLDPSLCKDFSYQCNKTPNQNLKCKPPLPSLTHLIYIPIMYVSHVYLSCCKYFTIIVRL